MLYRKLGNTDMNVSAVGFGGIPIQRVTSDEAKKVILHAEDKGINFIDSARGYTVSENYIGDALKGRRDKWYIASKSMVRTKAEMLKDIDVSLSNLKTDYIDLYQIHNIKEMESYALVTGENGALEGLLEAQKAGKVRYIGLTAHTMTALEPAIENPAFSTIMYPYNIVENQAEEIFKKAKANGTGVIAMKPMAGGALTNGELAMRYILQNENVSMAIPGMANIEEVDQNVKAAIDMRGLSAEESEECRKISEKLGQEFCRRCGYCAPCAKNIDIPFSFIVKAYHENYDLKEWAVGRYNAMAAHAGDCVECGLCEKRCPYNLPIRKMMKEVKETFGF